MFCTHCHKLTAGERSVASLKLLHCKHCEKDFDPTNPPTIVLEAPIVDHPQFKEIAIKYHLDAVGAPLPEIDKNATCETCGHTYFDHFLMGRHCRVISCDCQGFRQ